MLSLDSASDSDVVFIPNPPDTVTRVDSTSTDSEDNKPLAITKMKLKAEMEETKSDIKAQVLEFNLRVQQGRRAVSQTVYVPVPLAHGTEAETVVAALAPK